MRRQSRRQFTDEFKRQAVALVAEGKRVAEVAQELGVSIHSIDQWKKDLGHEVGPSGETPLEAENRTLRRKLR